MATVSIKNLVFQPVVEKNRWYMFLDKQWIVEKGWNFIAIYCGETWWTIWYFSSLQIITMTCVRTRCKGVAAELQYCCDFCVASSLGARDLSQFMFFATQPLGRPKNQVCQKCSSNLECTHSTCYLGTLLRWNLEFGRLPCFVGFWTPGMPWTPLGTIL